MLRINCETLDTLRTKECKEIIETVKINNLQQKLKFQYISPYKLCRKIYEENETMKTRQTVVKLVHKHSFYLRPKQIKFDKTEKIHDFSLNFRNFIEIWIMANN